MADFTQTYISRLETLDTTLLTPIVREALHDKSAVLLDWSQQAIEGGFSGAPVYRFAGEAQTAVGIQRWSAILKIFVPPANEQSVEDFAYWKREVLVYQSGLLSDLPAGLIAPRCLAITEYPANEHWLWQEDMAVENKMPWSLEQYGIAAHHLGLFNGGYLTGQCLTGQSLPNHPWLRQSDIQQRLALAEPGIPQLPQLCANPHFAGLIDEDQVRRIHHLWEQRQRLLTALETLPKTFCHFDAFPRNLIARHDLAGHELAGHELAGHTQTVALDWGSAGVGAVGEELVALFATTLKFFEVEIAQIPRLESLIFTGYLQGLRAAGWQGDETLARFGFTASIGLKAGVVEPAIGLPNVARRIAALPPGEKPPRFLSPGGYPQAAARERHLLALGEEAVSFLEQWQS